jgi:hypothetical protein
MLQKALAAVLLLIAGVSAAGASVCVRGDDGACCEGSAALQCTTGPITPAARAAEVCCTPAAVGQLSIAPADSAKDELSGRPDQRPDLPGVSHSVTTLSSAWPLRCTSHRVVAPATETGQTIYLKTGRLRL